MGEAHSEKNVCETCDEVFEVQECLVQHVIKEHMEVSSNPSIKASLCCNFYSETFHEKNDLMGHKKAEHREKVSRCWNLGTCMFGETNCWFRHEGYIQAQDIDCKLCNENFFNKKELQQHMKNNHPNTIPACRNILNKNECSYGEHCWYKHHENDTSEIDDLENNEIIQKIFAFMEKMTMKISKLENKIER